jgi:very-short-patch-repair endonuclease
LKLCIELDGQIHNTEEQKIIDEQRSQHLNELGLKIIRFRNEEILDDIELVKKKILGNIELIRIEIES